MNEDVRIDLENKKFKFRVCGILKSNGKYMIVRMGDSKFYCLPGGHVEIGESTKNAVIREMKEETGYDVKIEKLISITENFFNHGDIKFHEIAYYYLVSSEDVVDTENKVIYENDKGKMKKLEFVWWNPNEELDSELMPMYIMKKLINNDTTFENVIINDL